MLSMCYKAFVAGKLNALQTDAQKCFVDLTKHGGNPCAVSDNLGSNVLGNFMVFSERRTVS